MTAGLLDIPEDVMERILVDIGIKTILNLRQVCHGLRNLIDDLKPEATLEKIEINASSHDSTITILYEFSGGDLYAVYEKQMDGCLVRNFYKEHGELVKNEEFITVAMKHFEIVLGLQKSVLKQFTVTGHCEGNEHNIFLKNLQHVLKSKAQPLKVEKFTASSMDQNRLVSILPFLDSKTLTKIDLRGHESHLEVDQLVRLDQWRNIKHLILNQDCHVDYGYIEHFTHFSNEKIWFESIQFPDLVSLKDLLLQSSGFEVIKIKPINFDMNDVQRNIELLGESIVDIGITEDIKYRWYYSIPDTDQVLEICMINETLYENAGMRIKLSKIEISDMPGEAIFQN